MMLFCSNCESEAVAKVTHHDNKGVQTPLCYTCKEAYEWGQASPESTVEVLVPIVHKERTLSIQVCGGVVQGVVGLPDDWEYEIHDFDDDPDDCVDEADYEGTGCGRSDFPAMNQSFDDTEGPTP